MHNNRQKEMKEVWERYKAGVATSDDLILIESWYLQYEPEGLDLLTEKEIEERVARVRSKLPVHQKIYLWPRMTIAAAVLFVLSFGLYFLYNSYGPEDLKKEAMTAGIIPGKNKAILKLADGTEVSLNEAANGKIAEQSGVTVSKTKDGQLQYAASGLAKSQQLNSISTPNGGQWQVHLPDGSIVWLNAATTLTYPVDFSTEKTRTVTLNGEAYFEVAKNKNKPFIVHAAKQNVEVLGTHFNINAYNDEPAVKTSLLEGTVKVEPSAGNQDRAMVKILKPGEQSILNNQGIKVTQANVLMSVDWKNGDFRFKNESLSSILRKVSRWYDVRVVYTADEQNMPTFSGAVSRFDDVSSVLKMLEEAGDVHFSIDGRTIVVK